jgi:hypothetical protein
MKDDLQHNVAKLGEILPIYGVNIANKIKSMAVEGRNVRRIKLISMEKL